MTIYLGRCGTIKSIEEIIAEKNKLYGRPNVPISLGTPKTFQSRYTYKSPEVSNTAAAIADASRTELRRQVGEKQSLTNYYDSSTY